LIPVVLQAALGRIPAVTVFGTDYPTPDGTCVRDYIHVSDLARAHVLALEALASGHAGGAYNLGCGGAGYSVKQVIDVARAVCAREIPVRVGRAVLGTRPSWWPAGPDHSRAGLAPASPRFGGDRALGLGAAARLISGCRRLWLHDCDRHLRAAGLQPHHVADPVGHGPR